MFGFGKKKSGPPRPRPVPKDRPKPMPEDYGFDWRDSAWQVRMGEAYRVFTFEHNLFEVRVTDFVGTLTDLHFGLLDADKAIQGDVLHIVQRVRKQNLVQFKIATCGGGTVTVSQVPVSLDFGLGEESKELGGSWNAVRIEGQNAGDKINCNAHAEIYREHEGFSGDCVAEKEVAQDGLEYLDDVVTRLEQNQKESLRAVHDLGVTWLDTYEKVKKYVHVLSEEDVEVSQFRSFLNAIVRRLK